jgi:hypothetical protein
VRIACYQTAETVTDENERAGPRRRLGQPILKDMAGLGRDFPIGCLHKLVADCVASRNFPEERRAVRAPSRCLPAQRSSFREVDRRLRTRLMPGANRELRVFLLFYPLYCANSCGPDVESPLPWRDLPWNYRSSFITGGLRDLVTDATEGSALSIPFRKMISANGQNRVRPGATMTHRYKSIEQV